MISRVLAVLALALVAAPMVLGRGHALHATIAAAALAVATLARGVAPATRAIAVLLALLAAAGLSGLWWQAVMLLGLTAYLAVARVAPGLAPDRGWRARGALPWGWIAVVGGVTPVALLGWVALLRPDLADVVASYGVRDRPLALLVAGAAAFAVVNAVLEELLWRGVLQDRLAALFGSAVAIALTGIHFGLAHWNGVPRGPAGVLLAGAWGMMLGALRRHARGLAAPVIAHVVADTTIAAILLALYR